MRNLPGVTGTKMLDTPHIISRSAKRYSLMSNFCYLYPNIWEYYFGDDDLPIKTNVTIILTAQNFIMNSNTVLCSLHHNYTAQTTTNYSKSKWMELNIFIFIKEILFDMENCFWILIFFLLPKMSMNIKNSAWIIEILYYY